MTMDDRVEQAAQAIVGRAEERFQAHWMEIVSWTDRLFAKLMVGQWLFAIVIALVVSPYAWEGRVRTMHAHVWFAIFLGGAISVFPIDVAPEGLKLNLMPRVIAVKPAASNNERTPMADPSRRFFHQPW